MNIQARKLSLIDYLLKLKNESVIEKIENILKHNTPKKAEGLTIEDLNARNAIAQEEIKSGKTISQEKIRAHFLDKA